MWTIAKVMVPLVGMQYELQDQVALINSVAAEVQQQTGGWTGAGLGGKGRGG